MTMMPEELDRKGVVFVSKSLTDSGAEGLLRFAVSLDSQALTRWRPKNYEETIR